MIFSTIQKYRTFPSGKCMEHFDSLFIKSYFHFISSFLLQSYLCSIEKQPRVKCEGCIKYKTFICLAIFLWRSIPTKGNGMHTKQTKTQSNPIFSEIQTNLSHSQTHMTETWRLFLANVRLLDNKMDLMRLRLSSRNMRNCCVFLLTDTWLNNNLPDSAYQIDGLLLFRASLPCFHQHVSLATRTP